MRYALVDTFEGYILHSSDDIEEIKERILPSLIKYAKAGMDNLHIGIYDVCDNVLTVISPVLQMETQEIVSYERVRKLTDYFQWKAWKIMKKIMNYEERTDNEQS